jgi:hypothetical protein
MVAVGEAFWLIEPICYTRFDGRPVGRLLRFFGCTPDPGIEALKTKRASVVPAKKITNCFTASIAPVKIKLKDTVHRRGLEPRY